MSHSNLLLNVHEAIQSILNLCIPGIDWSDSAATLALTNSKAAISSDLSSAFAEYEFLVKLVKGQQGYITALQKLNESMTFYNETQRLFDDGNAAVEPETVQEARMDYSHWLAVEKTKKEELQEILKAIPCSLSLESTVLQ